MTRITNRRRALGIGFLLFITLLTCCIPTGRSIRLPNQDAISAIRLIHYREQQIIQDSNYTSKDDIAHIFSIIGNAKDTNQTSDAEVPKQSEYTEVQLYFSEHTVTFARLFLYAYDEQYVLERPFDKLYLIENGAQELI